MPDVDANLAAIPRAAAGDGSQGHRPQAREPDRFRRGPLLRALRHAPARRLLPKRYFQALLKSFDRDCEVLTVTDSGGKAVSSVLSFYSA
jgi:hypothetical protein